VGSVLQSSLNKSKEGECGKGGGPWASVRGGNVCCREERPFGGAQEVTWGLTVELPGTGNEKTQSGVERGGPNECPVHPNQPEWRHV